MPSSSQLIGDISACVNFYTRLPVSGGEADRGLAEAQWAAPVIGAVVGLIVAVTLLLAGLLGTPPMVAATLALAAGIAITGALHEDGLADVADGFGGGRTRDDKLAIMRDSRIGTYGALALLLSVLARWSALAALATAAPLVVVLATIAAHAGSRALIPCFMARVPAARRDGLSASVGHVEASPTLAALAIGVVLLLAAGLWFAIFAIALLAIFFFLLEKLALKQIGGHTGDVLGALQQGGEIALLCLAATLLI